MQDPTEDKIRALSKAITPQQLKDFIDAFPEFAQMNDSPEFRRLVSLAFLFAQNKIEKDDFPSIRIEHLKELCINLLGEDISPVNSELFKWINSAGKGKKGPENFDKFLGSFERFLASKLKSAFMQKITFEELKQLFPVFSEVNAEAVKEREVRIDELLTLIFRFRLCKDMKAERYKMMWLILEIGEIAEKIIPKEYQGGNLSNLEGKMSAQNYLLDKSVQFQLFRTARNVATDFLPLMYTDKIVSFLEVCSDLCMGRVIPDRLYRACNEWANQYTRGEDLIPLLRGKAEEQAKMFAQMGYFLYRAKQFFEQGEDGRESVCMALVAAGICARLINKAGIAKSAGRNVRFSSTSQLMNIRTILAHSRAPEYSEMSVYDTIAKTIPKIDGLILECEEDAKRARLDVNVLSYVQREKPNKDSESPRIFKKI
ncbi:MAG: hypothetical protein SFW07_02325 [Gammaproteobacteria bacterium]|nr:hypothetical protein [Gammaproteobacteria bacterium]